MQFTPKAVHEHATPDANEVLVSGVDETGMPHNILLRTHAALRAKLVATPAVITNPARAGVEAEAFAAAVAQVAAAEKAIADAKAAADKAVADAAAAAAKAEGAPTA